jgi:hypothetical protein
VPEACVEAAAVAAQITGPAAAPQAPGAPLTTIVMYKHIQQVCGHAQLPASLSLSATDPCCADAWQMLTPDMAIICEVRCPGPSPAAHSLS